MNLFQKPYLLFFPFLIFSIFLLDKIFLLDIVRDHFIQPGGMLYYRQRKEQIHRLRQMVLNKQIPDQDKLVLVLGDSRSFGLGMEVVKYLNIQNFSLWNFAGPQAVPAYHLYIAENILKFVNPDYFYIGISPDAFNRNTGIFGLPVLSYGVDQEFIKEYRNLIPEKDYRIYLKTRKYALLGLQFSFKTLFKRLKNAILNPWEKHLKKFNLEYESLDEEEKKVIQTLISFQDENLDFYIYEKSPQRKLLNYTQGAQYAWFGKMSEENLKKETEKLKNLYIKNFLISYEQLVFYQLLLEKIFKQNSKAIIFFPKVNPYLKKIYQTTPEIKYIQDTIINITKQYKFTVVDFNEDLVQCNDFYDASHLSVSCFPEVLQILLKYHN
ncbi:MAG: DUF1574 family protein [Leptonema sp. (in: bacteria)]